jgi:hypothetical protein
VTDLTLLTLSTISGLAGYLLLKKEKGSGILLLVGETIMYVATFYLTFLCLPKEK